MSTSLWLPEESLQLIYALSMKHIGNAIVCAHSHHMRTHTDTQYQWQRVPQKTRRLHMDSLDISHWLCDLVMQSPLIPTYDECTLEWRREGGGGGWNRDMRAAVREAVHCALRTSGSKKGFVIHGPAEGRAHVRSCLRVHYSTPVTGMLVEAVESKTNRAERVTFVQTWDSH